VVQVAVFWTFLLMLAIVLSLIAVHEAGHFLAGIVAGIPARDMRIVLLAFPQHVAQRDGDRWVSPIKDIERFITVSRRHLASRSAAFLWVAGE
jgi:membrane-associated protease RseP (regulator of RpoE activity)